MNPRVALATGAAGGQGWAIAERLRAKGYSVAACDVRAGELVAAVDELGDEDVIAVELDVTSPARWDAVVERVVERFGLLSTLVNCAGALHRASLAEETPEGFETAWRVNCLGAFLGMRATLDRLRAAENASIVNICSTGAIRPFSRHCASGSSKWALRALTQSAAADWPRPASGSTPCSPDRSRRRCSTTIRRKGWPGFRGGIVRHGLRTGHRWRAMPAAAVNQSNLISWRTAVPSAR
jgi:NAD(P)-dependent dehydrogenase (short-subunit alcohol dehydrogenase family)